MAYNDLSLSERAEVIRMGVQAGLKSLSDIRSFYDNAANEYAEGGGIHIAPSKKGTFAAAATKHGKSVQAFASQVLAHKENYSPAMVKKANFARNASKWHADGGPKDITTPALNVILKNRNSLDRKYDFIVDTWDSEYTVPRGYDAKKNLYFPYNSPEGGTQTIGPGIKLRNDGKGDAFTFSAEEAKNGVTEEQINEKLGNHAEQQYQKVLEFLNQNGNRLPYDTISPSIMRGLMDTRYQVGSLGKFNNLREAVLNGDLEGIKQESKVYFKTPSGKVKEDARRNQYRADHFWHYSTGGSLYLYPFSFQKKEDKKTPVVRFEEGGNVEQSEKKTLAYYPDPKLSNVEMWLYKYKPTGIKGQPEKSIYKRRPKTVNPQNIQDFLISEYTTKEEGEAMPWTQYVWDDPYDPENPTAPHHTTYTAWTLYPGNVPELLPLRAGKTNMYFDVPSVQAEDILTGLTFDKIKKG